MDIPLFDLSTWRAAEQQERVTLAARLDQAMRDSGFFLVSGHGIDASLTDRIRAEARTFFTLPGTVKDTYATGVGGRGWIPAGGR